MKKNQTGAAARPSSHGMNFLYDPARIGIVTRKKLSPYDRVRLRILRRNLRDLWNPDHADEIRSWQKRSGINTDLGIWKFGNMSDHEKEFFFNDTETFIKSILKKNKRRRQANILSGLKLPYSTVDSFAILGLPRNASCSRVRQRFRKLVFRYHPDHGGDVESFRIIYEAYNTLNDNS